MLLIPAIDLRGGRCVRLFQGDFDQEFKYHEDPVECARRWSAAGARWLHVVDLDGARAGRPVQLDVVSGIARLGLPVQLGGGLRSVVDVERALDTGVNRVILGTSAGEGTLETMARAFPGRVWAGLDVDTLGQVRVRGWEETSGRDPRQVARRALEVGASGIVYTATGRDGTMAGPDCPGWLAQLGAPVIYAGGVGQRRHLEQLARAGRKWLSGIIAGRALYEGTLIYQEGQKALEEE